MHWRVIMSCVCADVSNFKQMGVKVFVQNIWQEYQNLAIIMYNTNFRSSHPEVLCKKAVLWPATLLNRGSSIDVFLWVLRNF